MVVLSGFPARSATGLPVNRGSFSGRPYATYSEFAPKLPADYTTRLLSSKLCVWLRRRGRQWNSQQP